MSCEWIYTIDEEGQTPLNRAIKSSHMALTELLLRQEAEDGMASLDGASLLHKAAFLGLQEAVKAILAEGANPNELDRQGETPLHKAAREGHFEVAKLLVEHGANVNVVSEFGLTPLHWVALNGRLGIANLLMNAGADPYLSDEYLDQLSPVDLAKIMDYDDLVAILERRPASHV